MTEPEPGFPLDPPPRITEHTLARELLRKHGRDRYPTIELNGAKVCAEAGELMDAILHHHTGNHGGHIGRCHDQGHEVAHSIRHEIADTCVSLHLLADKLGINLVEAMADLVEHETRSFA